MSLHVGGLRFGYDGPLLRGIEMEIASAESGFLLGPSGSGKSTLLRCIAGLEQGYSGTVTVAGRRLDELPAHRRRVGLLFQEPALFPHLDAAHNVAFGLRMQGRSKREALATAADWLARVELEARGGERVHEMSGGERQRVALARALAAGPDAVLLDEPLSALDAPLRVRLGEQVKLLLAEAGVPALWVTHDEAEATRLADRRWRLVDGRAQTQ